MSAHFNDFTSTIRLTQNVLAKSRSMAFAQTVRSSVSLKKKKAPRCNALLRSVLEQGMSH